jgi:hypothetical protein
MNAQATTCAKVEVRRNRNGLHFGSTKNVNRGGFHLGSCGLLDEKHAFHPYKGERYN